MATLMPFAALRPPADMVARVSCPPYDVPNDREARAIASEPLSFIRITRPETAMEAGADGHSSEAYGLAARLFAEAKQAGTLRREDTPCYYVYRLTWRGRSQTGLVALASCDEYRRGIVRRHELTRPDKENDRTRHISDLRAQTGPVFLAFRSGSLLDEMLALVSGTEPEVDFTAPDGVRHEVWSVSRPEDIVNIQLAAKEVPILYICDGHHRAAAATRAVSNFRGDRSEPLAAHIFSVAFPHDQLRILPYHRVLADLNGMTPEAVDAAIGAVTDDSGPAPANGEPGGEGEFCYYVAGAWRRRRFAAPDRAAESPADRLDVSVLQRRVLGPVFGIEDPRTNPRIRFVGGIKGTEALAREVSAGEGAIAFAMHPTPMEAFLAVADANLLMPPKSTWFEPKLRDGIFVHAW